VDKACLTRYFDELGRCDNIVAWQFRQAVSAVQMLFEMRATNPVVREFDWEERREAARELGDERVQRVKSHCRPDPVVSESGSWPEPARRGQTPGVGGAEKRFCGRSGRFGKGDGVEPQIAHRAEIAPLAMLRLARAGLPLQPELLTVRLEDILHKRLAPQHHPVREVAHFAVQQFRLRELAARFKHLLDLLLANRLLVSVIGPSLIVLLIEGSWNPGTTLARCG
jgi:hypothetical protein